MGKDLKGKDLGVGIRQRKDGRYEARATVNGQKISLYNMNLSNLRKEFAIMKADAIREKVINNYDIKLKEWYQKWFTQYKSPNLKNEISRNQYNRKCKNTYIAELGLKKVSDISQLDIQAATNELIQKGYSERTVKEGLGVLRECFEMAMLNHITNCNPCQQIKIKDTHVQKERRVLDRWEQDLFIQEVESSYYYEAYLILLSTGMRAGEFAGLQWEDIDWQHKEINIRHSMSTGYVKGVKIEELGTPKTNNSFRKIPFVNQTEQLLKSWRIKQTTLKRELGQRWRCKPEWDLVFTTRMGSPVTRYVLQSDLKNVVKNMQLKENYQAMYENRTARVIEHIHPHALRHTFATRCFEQSVDPVVIQALMGHANYATTLSYTHLLDDKRRTEISKIGSII